MAYVLQPYEALGFSLQRLLARQMRGAFLDLQKAARGGPCEPLVHAARVRIKLLRAMLRLLRPRLGSAVYHRENQALGNVSRLLSSSRDDAVAQASLARLGRESVAAAVQAQAALLRQALQPDDSHDRLSLDRRCRQACRQLWARLEKLDDWLPADIDESVLVQGLVSTYRAARADYRLAAKDDRQESLHEARKNAKYLMLQGRAVKKILPQGCLPRSRKLQTYTDLLGEHHDLFLLVGKIKAAQRDGRVRQSPDALLNAIAQRQTELAQKALPMGRRLWRKKPSQLREELLPTLV
ncbi:MAG: CHAD domain-containing protein [Phycisphaeraceae bacterium]|nr:CHAD domain-containing protein [Phycisphaeraceae bacterium]